MYAPIIFNANTDYTVAESIIKQMFSDIIANKCECNTDLDCNVGSLMVAIDIDRNTNTSRWQKDIETAYFIMKSNCSC